MRKAIIRDPDGFVINVISLDDAWTGVQGEWQPPESHSVIDALNCQRGDTWNGTIFISGIPALELSEVIANRIQQVNALRDEKAASDFMHGGRTFDAGLTSKLAINHVIAYGQLNSIADVTTRSWTLADNSTVTVSWGDLRAMATALFERNDAYHANLQTHKGAIDALSTVSAVKSYDITTGW